MTNRDWGVDYFCAKVFVDLKSTILTSKSDNKLLSITYKNNTFYNNYIIGDQVLIGKPTYFQ